MLYATVAGVFDSVSAMPANANYGVCYCTADYGLYTYNGTEWVLDSYLYEPIGGEVILATRQGCYYRYDSSDWQKMIPVMESMALGLSDNFNFADNVVLPSISLGTYHFDFSSDTSIVMPSMSLQKGMGGSKTDVIGFGME